MSNAQQERTYPLEQALRAQKALRDLAGLPPEMFPVSSFVGMVSDEIETLRQQGHSDEQIARTIEEHSAIEVSAGDLAAHYATPEERHSHE
jgi:hypothetical protein